MKDHPFVSPSEFSRIWWYLPEFTKGQEKPVSSASVVPSLSSAWLSFHPLHHRNLTVAVPCCLTSLETHNCQSPLWYHPGARELNSSAFDLSLLLCFGPDRSQSCFLRGHLGPFSVFLLPPACMIPFCVYRVWPKLTSFFELQGPYLPAKPTRPISLGRSSTMNAFLFTSVDMGKGVLLESVPWGFSCLPFCFSINKGTLGLRTWLLPCAEFYRQVALFLAHRPFS
jgi:hypothetical protein